MKKVFQSLLAMTIAAISFTSCEDVPAPYLLGWASSGNGSSSSTDIYSENFDDGTTNFTFNVVSGPAIPPPPIWAIGNNNGRYYLKASGYIGGTDYASEAWAISPAINLGDSHQAKLSFRHAINYLDDTSKMKDWMSVWVSTDTQNWNQLEVPSYPNGSSWTFVSSGDIDLTEYCGQETVYIAFKYISAEGDAATWEVDDFTVSGDGTPMEPVNPQPIPSGDVTGTGTQEDPFNVAGVMVEASKLASGTTGTEDVYTKGYIVEIKEFVTRYNSISYYIADDPEGTTNRFYVYSGKNFGGQDFTSINDLSVGDLVVVCGKLTNYSGTLEYQYNNYLVERNGQTDSGTPNPNPQPSGSNLLVNGDFESWTNGLPDHWKSTSTAGNATLSQSTDAHGGSYAVNVAVASANKRMAYKEIELKKGTYTADFFVKAAGADGASINKGYVPVVNGAVGSYSYDGYVNDISTEWQEVSYSFTLDADATICLVVMIPKNSKSDVIIDDFTLTTADGGLIGGDTPAPSNAITFDFKANGQGDWTIFNGELPDNLEAIWTYSNVYGMKATAFANSTKYQSSSMLISPTIDLSNMSTATLKITHAGNKFAGAVSDECRVLICTDANARVEPLGADWTELTVNGWPAGTNWTFVDGTADLSAYAGQSSVYIAFLYTSTANSAGTWEISKVSIE